MDQREKHREEQRRWLAKNPGYPAKYARENYDKKRAYILEWKKRNPEKSRAYGKAKQQRRRELLDAAKNVPCMDCGVRFPPFVMHFDHVRGQKEFTIGIGGLNNSHERVMAELAKCDVVCANCHHVRTQYRRNKIWIDAA